MQIKSVCPQANDSDPDDPDINDTNNHAEINENIENSTQELEPNSVKDLGDLNTGPAQPILSVSLNNILVMILHSYLGIFV